MVVTIEACDSDAKKTSPVTVIFTVQACGYGANNTNNKSL